MPRYQYRVPNRLSRLHDELLATGIVPERVEGRGDNVWITVPDTVTKARVDSTVAAHTPLVYVTEEREKEQLVKNDLLTLHAALTDKTTSPVLVAVIRQLL